ncbi:unnamed protein product (macronuclear) [Paramecium tetraurelia]|uniref:Tubulin-tyrosine ligase family protein n=1 Tax=Paramecium tetraurelia TaxID=5888 RepID=A0BCB7_PARTE|nr:uncharacterized protein GSPATT00004278001 [Paramecium tetraurelia]CAK56184.1 unnamed protein product [Paramecium tetraurelia]|eukprot:XP_001423582.1 hypothetical protein (macronuclear) [Paramecium tetraurelia strain d4-2]
MLKQNEENEIPFNGEFEDSEEESEEFSEEDSEDDELQNKRKKKRKQLVNNNKRLIMNVSDTQYAAVKFVGKILNKFQLQYTPYLETQVWDFCWTDNAVLPETLARMQSHQRINHFPGMYCIARKNYLGKNLNKMAKQFPEEFDFYPKTWMLPSDISDLRQNIGKIKYFIVKPEASCQGRGIFLTKQVESIASEHCVVQRYLHKPLLIDGLKFDFRMYVLLAGCDPLRIYLFKEGLARFATQPYQLPNQMNAEEMCMHLTNYAINKDNPNFVFNTDEKQLDVGHKRSLSSVFKLLSEQTNIDELMAKIKDLIIKTFCSVQPFLQSNYTQPDNYANNMCFEILGFDIIIDNAYKPYLLEVNHTPSFTADTPLDALIKKNLIRDTITLMNINLKVKNDLQQLQKEQMQRRVLGKKPKLSNEEKKSLKLQAQVEREQYESQHLGNFEKIYPCDKSYDEYLQHAQKIYEEWTGANIRRNVKKDNATERDKLPQQRQLQHSITIQGSIDSNNKPSMDPAKPSIRKSLYKHVHSKVFSNINPQKSMTELPQQQQPIEYKLQDGNDNEIAIEDQQNNYKQQEKIDRSKRPPSFYVMKSVKQGSELQLVDLFNYKRISIPETSPQSQPIMLQQQSLQISQQQQQQSPNFKSATQLARHFSIRKTNKSKLKPSESDQEAKKDLIQAVNQYSQFQQQQQQQSFFQSQQQHLQNQQQQPNGSFVKPKVFNLKLQPPHFKIPSLPILMQQQNYYKFRYD